MSEGLHQSRGCIRRHATVAECAQVSPENAVGANQPAACYRGAFAHTAPPSHVRAVDTGLRQLTQVDTGLPRYAIGENEPIATQDGTSRYIAVSRHIPVHPPGRAVYTSWRRLTQVDAGLPPHAYAQNEPTVRRVVDTVGASERQCAPVYVTCECAKRTHGGGLRTFRPLQAASPSASPRSNAPPPNATPCYEVLRHATPRNRMQPISSSSKTNPNLCTGDDRP